MKFYIAGRFSHEPSRLLIEEMIAALTELGHECTFNWTIGPTCKPYVDNVALNQKNVLKATKGALESELFIMVSHPEGTGMYVEYGLALAEHLRTGVPKMYLIGDYQNCSMFNYHPNVTWKNSLDEILEDLKKSSV
jgi:hypothetical protein